MVSSSSNCGTSAVNTAVFVRHSAYSPALVRVPDDAAADAVFRLRRPARSMATVRMATLNWACRSGRQVADATGVDAAGIGSNSRMISIVRTFGRPVIEAGGKSARKISTSGAAVSAATVEVICKQRGIFFHVECRARPRRCRVGQCGPGRCASCPRSWRFPPAPSATRPTPRVAAASSWPVQAARRGPLHRPGRQHCSPSRRKNSSGEAEQMTCRPVST